MARVFISYGSGEYAKSLQRIGREAKKLGLFSKIILFSEKDMPPFIKASPLKAYPRGDGYWAWKPYIIWKTLQDYPNDIVVYADCGCTLQDNISEWETWFQYLNTYKTLVFQYRSDIEYPWQSSTVSGMSSQQWTKQSVIDYFSPLFENQEWVYSNQIWAGAIITRGKNSLIKMWLDIALFHPELFMDVYGKEAYLQSDSFIEHRHDQSLLTALCLFWLSKGEMVKIIPETSESSPSAAIVASRIHDKKRVPFSSKLKKIAKNLLGDALYSKLRLWKKRQC